ncbi:hypothetical protein Tco_0957410 [Tanacetum coccineum]
MNCYLLCGNPLPKKGPKAATVDEPIKASDAGLWRLHANTKKETDIPKHKQNNKKSSPLEEVNFASLKNPFASLKYKEDIFENNDKTRNTNIGSSKHDSDSEVVKNMFVKNATFMKGKINTKKVEVSPKKTPRKAGIWTGRKAESPKRNIVFFHEMNVHYFDRDDMKFDDIGHAVEEVAHENAYSGNG